MVEFRPYPYDEGDWRFTPIQPPAYPMDPSKPQKVKERHVKEVKKGIMIRFEDGTWMFLATDDECYEKIKEALKDE